MMFSNPCFIPYMKGCEFAIERYGCSNNSWYKLNMLSLQFVLQYMRIEIKCDGYISKQTQEIFSIV